MSVDTETMAFYDENVAEYAAFSSNNASNENLARFIGAMPGGGRTLDLGCGIGWAAAEMAEAGLVADAMDASAGLVSEAKARYGIDVRKAGFTILSSRQRYDGIWSHFALQHAPRNERVTIFERINTALKPGGLFVAGMHKGFVDWRDEHGRLYCPFSEADLEELLSDFAEVNITQHSGRGFDGKPMLALRVWAQARK